MRRFSFPRDRAGPRLEPPRAEPSAQAPGLLPRGVHRLPLLDADGEPLVAAVDRRGRVVTMRSTWGLGIETVRAQLAAELERRDPDAPPPPPRRATPSGAPLHLEQ